jgi:hypothetical protein
VQLQVRGLPSVKTTAMCGVAFDAEALAVAVGASVAYLKEKLEALRKVTREPTPTAGEKLKTCESDCLAIYLGGRIKS